MYINMNNIIKNLNKMEGPIAAAGFSVVLIFVGLPIWWWTTTVYRAALPYSAIEHFASQDTYHSVNISIINDRFTLKDDLEQKLLAKDDSIKFVISRQDASDREKELLHSTLTSKDFEPFLQHLAINNSSLKLYILSENFTSPENHSGIYISKRKVIFIKHDVDIELLVKVIHSMAINPNRNLGPTKHIKLPQDVAQDKGIQLMRQVPTEPAYDVTLTLMLPQPHLLKAKWEISQAVKDYLEPMVDQLKDIVKLRIRSQVLYMTSMKINPKWSSKFKHYSLPEKQLPLTINSIEAKLGSFVSTRPSLHFIVYVPTDLQTPLQIHTDEGLPLEANSFLVPRWGGIMIHNPPNEMGEKRENVSLPLTFHIDSHWVMKTVIFQLHKLFPIPSLNDQNVKFTTQMYANELADWQIDGLARARVLSYLNSIKITLQSLCDLVGEISNMVVSDEVAGWVWSAVDDWKLCLDASREGRLEEAMSHCKSAFVYSDAAFFHPSMLALLYFPDNQKYAIYVPLFLPVSIPVVLSLRTIFKLKNFKSKND